MGPSAPSQSDSETPRRLISRISLHRRRVALAIAFGIVLLGGLAVGVSYERSFEFWSQWVERPGYTLLYKQETPTHDFAIFDAGGSQMAICVRSRGDSNTAPRSYTVFSADGQDLIDMSAPNRFNELSRVYVLPFGRYVSEPDGVMYPIRRKYRGKVGLLIEDRSQTILDVSIPWQRK